MGVPELCELTAQGTHSCSDCSWAFRFDGGGGTMKASWADTIICLKATSSLQAPRHLESGSFDPMAGTMNGWTIIDPAMVLIGH
jgi:hypothetical protein